MECKVKNEYGTIYIAEDVMLKVVGYAALECYGIVAMSGQRATDGIVEWLGRENLTKGVQIRKIPWQVNGFLRESHQRTIELYSILFILSSIGRLTHRSDIVFSMDVRYSNS